MESVVIACKSSKDNEKFTKVLKKHYNVIVIESATPFNKIQNKIDLLLLDHGFTANSGIDFLMDVHKLKSIPILFLTPDNDPQCAVEALRAGAFNYVVKTGNFISILNIAIRDAISKFNERKNLKDKITELQKKIDQQEESSGKKQTQTQKKALPANDIKTDPLTKEKKEINLVEEIISRFKKGEINLPSLPQINLKFKKILEKGAGVEDVAKLLKQDVAISSTLINISNTAFYKGMEENKTLENAISRLGLRVTRQYVEVISNRSLYTSHSTRFSNIMEKLWIHSLACAFASNLISSTLRLKTDSDTFTLGLIHDIGKLVLLQIIGELEIKGKFDGEIEHEKLNQTLESFHGRFGAVLLKRWAFSESHIQVALYHDSIEDVKNPGTEFLVVHFANLLVNSIGFSIKEVNNIDLEGSQSCYLLRLRTGEIEDIKTKVIDYIKDIKGVF